MIHQDRAIITKTVGDTTNKQGDEMRLIDMRTDDELETFARDAAAAFAKDPMAATYSGVMPIDVSKYLAVRWGMAHDCVLVLKLDEQFEPVCYRGIIRDGVGQ